MQQQPGERCARDLMQQDVITVSPEMPILDVYRMFVEEEIHGAPVVDDAGTVRGVVSTLDLLRIVRGDLEPDRGATATTADDVATRELVTVAPEATVQEVARKMLEQHVHRVLVVDGYGELVGVISSFDLLRVVANSVRR